LWETQAQLAANTVETVEKSDEEHGLDYGE